MADRSAIPRRTPGAGARLITIVDPEPLSLMGRPGVATHRLHAANRSHTTPPQGDVAMTAALTGLVESTEIAVPARRRLEVVTGGATPARRPGRADAALNAFAALLLVLLALPVLIAVAVAVRLGGGPVLFRQTRIGQGGRDLTMLKFRSMCVDAETRLAELLDSDEGAGPLFKMTDDPRITRTCAVLRSSRSTSSPSCSTSSPAPWPWSDPAPPCPAKSPTTAHWPPADSTPRPASPASGRSADAAT